MWGMQTFRVQSEGRSYARNYRGCLTQVREELRDQTIAGSHPQPWDWRDKGEGSVILVLGPPGRIWNHCSTSRLGLESRRKGCRAGAEESTGCCQTPSETERRGAITWLLPSSLSRIRSLALFGWVCKGAWGKQFPGMLNPG